MNLEEVLYEMSELCNSIGAQQLEVNPRHRRPISTISKVSVSSLKEYNKRLAELLNDYNSLIYKEQVSK